MFCLSEDEVHLWVVRPDQCRDAALLAAYRRVLDEEEIAQWASYRVEKKKLEHLISRALVRTTLSQYLPIVPEKWKFIRSAGGKPAIDRSALKPLLADRPSETLRLEFNLSHTEGMIICAVTVGAAIGVDIENTSRPADCLPLARRFFHPAESALLENLPSDQLPLAFYRIWTLKEAYLKALGTGLTTGLDAISFSWPNGNLPPLVSFPLPSGGEGVALNLPEQTAPQLLIFSAGATDHPQAWQFREFLLEGRFQVALALARPSERPLQITLRQSVPLANPQ